MPTQLNGTPHQTLTAALLRLTRGESRPGTVRGGRDRAWWKNGWLWVGVGTVAVAASTWVLLSQDDQTDTIITIEPCGFGGACSQ